MLKDLIKDINNLGTIYHRVDYKILVRNRKKRVWILWKLFFIKDNCHLITTVIDLLTVGAFDSCSYISCTYLLMH